MNKGQAIVEYILLLAVIASMLLTLQTGLSRLNIGQMLYKSIFSPYESAYRYGHPKGKGLDDPQGPSYHPRMNQEGNNNNRLFQNPKLN